jgi:hypothetical protein
MIGTSDGEETAFSSTIWEDEEEQRFYEYLADMKEFLPSITVRPPEPVSEVSQIQLWTVQFLVPTDTSVFVIAANFSGLYQG